MGVTNLKMYRLLLVFVMLAGIILSACTPETAGNDVPSNDNNVGDKRDSLKIALEDDPVTLLANTDVNSLTTYQIRNIYDPLTDRDGSTGEIIPALATEWGNVDELTWEFNLRDDVTFHNGEKFNAEAVKYNIDYILDESNNSAYRSRWSNVEKAEVIDEFIVHIITKTPDPYLISVVEDLLIMEPGQIEEEGIEETAKGPVGTGAYKFDEWKQDQELRLIANEDYWKGEPSIKEVTFVRIPELSSKISSLLSGEVDLIRGINTDSIDRIEANDSLEIETVSSVDYLYINFNTLYDGPLQEKKVRQALSYAIDVEELLEGVKDGYGEKMNGPFTKLNEDYVETTGYNYNPEEAKKLLKEAGFEPSDISLQLDVSIDADPMDVDVAQAVAGQLVKIGIEVDVNVNEWGSHLAMIRQGEMKDMFVLGWTSVFDAKRALGNSFSQDGPYSVFHDSQLEEKVEIALATFDDEERGKIMEEIQHYLIDQAAVVPFWQREMIYGVSKDLNFDARVDSKMTVFDMSW